MNSFGGYDASVPNDDLAVGGDVCGTFAASASSFVGGGERAATRRHPPDVGRGGRPAAVAARPAPGEDDGERSTGECGGELAGERHGCNLQMDHGYAGDAATSGRVGPTAVQGLLLSTCRRDEFTAVSHTVIRPDCTVTVAGNRNPARPRGVGETDPANTEDTSECRSSRTWPRWPPPSRPAAATRGRTRTRPAKYVDQAAAFVDKQTKGKYSGQINGVVGKVKTAAGLPPTTAPRPTTRTRLRQAPGLRRRPATPDPLDHRPAPSTTPPPVSTPPTRSHGRPGAHRRAALPGQQGPLIDDRRAAPPPPTRRPSCHDDGTTRPVAILTRGGHGPDPSGRGSATNRDAPGSPRRHPCPFPTTGSPTRRSRRRAPPRHPASTSSPGCAAPTRAAPTSSSC